MDDNGRIEHCFARLKRENRAGLIPFVMAGDPDPETSFAIVRALPAAGDRGSRALTARFPAARRR